MTKTNRACILIVDDHALVRNALSVLLSQCDDFEVCGEAADVDEALDRMKSTQVDIVLVDISLKSGHASGIDLIKKIKVQYPSAKTITFSLYDESLHGERAMRAGAMGYVNKNDPQHKLVDAIRDVLDGKMHFSSKISERVASQATISPRDIAQ